MLRNAAFLLIVVLGCSGSQEVTDNAWPTPLKLPDRVLEARRARILSHFIDGSTLDAQSKFAEAILEYQEILRLEPNHDAAMYALSKDYAEIGKLARASEFGREAVRLNPSNISYREHLATLHVSALQQDLAIKEYEKIIEIDSTRSRARYNLARLIEQKKPLQALAMYEDLMDREGESWELLLRAAEINSALGKHDDAIRNYEAMLEIEPGNDPLKRQLAETYSKAGRFEDARTLVESMLEVHPEDPDLLLVMADMSLSQSEFEKARALYRQVLAQKGLHPEVRVRIGVTLFAMMDRDTSFFTLAKDIFVGLRSEQPNDWRPHWYLGALALNREPDSIAAQSFAEVTRLEPRNGDAWWYLGTIYFDNAEYEQVFETMYRARQVLPNDFRVYLLLGLAHTRSGEESDAVNELYKAYKLNPKDINVLSTLALSLDGLKRHDESDRLYEEALLVDSTNALILNNFSYSLSERGLQLERALRMATKAVTAEPQNSSYLDTIGWIHFMLGEYEPARTYIEKAIAAGDASAVVVEHLGDVYGKLGRAEDARVQWKKAFELDPTSSSLREKLGLPPQ